MLKAPTHRFPCTTHLSRPAYPDSIATQYSSLASWDVGGLGGKHIKYLVKNYVRSLSPTPLVIGLQELKTAHFLTTVVMNVIQPDYHHIISLPFEGPFEGKGGTTLMYHPSFQLMDSSTMNRGRVAWAQLKLDTIILSVAMVYVSSDSPKAHAYMWHQLKTELPEGKWIIFGDFNMTEIRVDSFGPSPLLQGRQLGLEIPTNKA